MTKKTLIALAIPIILSLTSCGDSDDGAGSSDATTDAGSDALVVTWDETGCVYEGPAEVPAGAVAVDYVNNGDASSNLAVFMLDGISVEDVMDDFATEPRTTRVTAGYLDTGGGAPADPGETLQWERNLAPGEYVMLCARSRPSFAAWFGSGLTVVEG